MVDLRVFPNKEADGSYPSETPGKAKDQGKEQMQKLTKLTKKHRNGHMTKVDNTVFFISDYFHFQSQVDWLDRLTFRELGLINNEEKSRSEYLYLMIEFPTIYVDGIPHYVVYFEQNGEDIHSIRANTDIVTVPDQEILRVSRNISLWFILEDMKAFLLRIWYDNKNNTKKIFYSTKCTYIDRFLKGLGYITSISYIFEFYGLFSSTLCI